MATASIGHEGVPDVIHVNVHHVKETGQSRGAYSVHVSLVDILAIPYMLVPPDVEW